MTITAIQALSQIQNLSGSARTVENVRAIVAQVDASVAGATEALIYSGKNEAGEFMSDVARNFAANNPEIAIIDNTEIFDLLNDNPQFELELQNIINEQNATTGSNWSFQEVFDGKDVEGGVRVANDSMWDIGSRNFVEQAPDDIKVFAVNADPNGVLLQTEIPALQEKGGTLNGLPASELSSDASIRAKQIEQVSVAEFSLLKSVDTGAADGAIMLVADNPDIGDSFASKVFSSTTLKVLGVVGAIIDLGYLAYEVEEKLSAGDVDGAFEVAGDWVADNVEGALGAVAAVGILTLLAPAVATAAAGSIVAGAAILSTAVVGGGAAAILLDSKSALESLGLLDSPESGTKIPLGEQFINAPKNVYVNENGEMEIDENGQIRQASSMQIFVMHLHKKMVAA